jgi:hypothetical protein
MIPICLMPHLRSDPYIEGAKNRISRTLSTQSGSELTQSRCAEAMSVKMTSSGLACCSMSSCAPLPSLRDFGPGVAQDIDRIQLRPVSNIEIQFRGLPSAF